MTQSCWAVARPLSHLGHRNQIPAGPALAKLEFCSSSLHPPYRSGFVTPEPA